MGSRNDLLISAIVGYSKYNAGRTLGTGEESQFSSKRFGGAIALLDPGRPRSPMFNRVLGLGVGEIEMIPEILQHYEAAGEDANFDISLDGLLPEVVMALTEQGFEPDEALHYLSMPPRGVADQKIEVERWEADRADTFRELLAESGVVCDDSVWELRRELYCTDQFRVFVASIEGEPSGWGTSYADWNTETVFLANAYTKPERREQGCHTALLGARIADAESLGFGAAFTDVVPESTSGRNCEKVGFEAAETMTLWRRSR